MFDSSLLEQCAYQIKEHVNDFSTKKKDHSPTERQQMVALKPKEVGRLERIIMEIRAGISDTMGTKIWLTNISESDLRIIAKKVGVLNSNVRATKADLIRLIVNRIELEEL